MPDGTAYDPYPGQTSTTGGTGTTGNSNNNNGTYQGGNTGYNWSGYKEWLEMTKNSTKTCNLIVNYFANGYNGSAAENPPSSSVRSYTGQSVDVYLTVTIASGETMSNPGYVFVGWATTDSSQTIAYNPGDTITAYWGSEYRGNSVTDLYAIWTNQNVITYHPDDNSKEQSDIYQVKESGQAATLKSATFTRTGYTQVGWSTTKGGSKNYDLGGTYSSDAALELYPVWQANTYTVTYLANQGTGTMAVQTVTYDSTFTPSECTFTREGYSFFSWNESADGKGIRWKVQEYTVNRAEDIILYAIWRGNEYTISYNDNYSRYSDEITGDIVTFESEYAQPLKKVEVSLSPIQDLHGYSNPWPAGGGKNKFDLEKIAPFNANVTVTKTADSFTVTNNNTYTVNPFRASDGDMVFAVTDGTYSISMASAISFNLAIYASSDGTSYSWYDGGITAGQTSRTFTVSGKTHIKVMGQIPANSSVTISKFQLESGSVTSYAPYSNICPISGRTGLSVYRTGNPQVWDEQWEVGDISASNGQNVNGSTTIRTKNYISVVPDKTYYCHVGVSATANMRARWYDANHNFIGTSPNVPYNGTFTVPSNAYYLRFTPQTTYGTTYNNDISINYPSTDHEYHAYNGNTYAVDWTTQAGTVYHGTFDPVTRQLTVTMASVDLGSLDWTYSSSYGGFFHSTGIQSLVADKWECIAEAFKNVRLNSTGITNNDGAICINRNGSDGVVTGAAAKGNIIATYKQYTDATLFKAAVNGTYLCYELATPLTYQLTGQEMETLVGANNVWSNGGPIAIVYALDEVPQNMPPSTAVFGDPFVTRRNQFTRFGLTFTGWNTSPDGTGDDWLPSGVAMDTYKRTTSGIWDVSHNVTLYAQWDSTIYPYGTVFFNGKNAKDMGIIVEELPSYYYAERAFNHKQVNGKNGDVILDSGRYENVKKVYKVACYDPSRNFYESAVALSTFLHSSGSEYIRLEDSYEPTSYRMAIYEEMNEIENILGKAGKCDITFNCMPQRFLLSGDEEINIPSSGYTIYNPTAFDAKPLIRIQGVGTVTVNGRRVTVTDNDNDMLVDCETQNAKDLSGADMNYFIYCDEFPVLSPGFNTIVFEETIDAVKITPRWWIL